MTTTESDDAMDVFQSITDNMQRCGQCYSRYKALIDRLREDTE